MNAATYQASNLQRDAINSLVKKIASMPTVRRVLLFGSRARGDADERSDVDIAVDAPNLTRRQWVTIVHAAEDAETLLRIQVINLSETEAVFRHAVEAEGIALYEREEKH